MKYESQLDGLRAISVMLVIFNHIPKEGLSFIRGEIGVDIFFAISGFLITNILLIEYDKLNCISIGKFYIRRAFRILPLYFVTIFIYLIAAISIYALSHNAEKLNDFQSALPYIATLNSEFRSVESHKILGHAWSLGIEEKFYIFWPLLLPFMCRKWIVQKALLVGVISMSALILDHNSFMVRGYVELVFASVITVIVHRYNDKAIYVFARNCGLFLIGALASYGVLLCVNGILGNILIGGFTTFLIISLHLLSDQRLNKILSHRILVLIGRLSYGVYLIHVLAINVVTTVFQRMVGYSPLALTYLAAIGISIGVAYLLQIAIERPMIEFGRSLLRQGEVKAEQLEGRHVA